jgi:hypothetical protein
MSAEHDCDCNECKELREMVLYFRNIRGFIWVLKTLSAIAVAGSGLIAFFDIFKVKQ